MFLRALSGLAPTRILEVGPGPGTLTYWIAEETGVPVAAVEVDRRLVRAAARAAGHPLVAYVAGDGVGHVLTTGSNTLVSNTPYNLTSPIIAAAARNNNLDSLVLGVQKEVANRITAGPGEQDYGRLTLLASRYFSVEYAGFLPRSWFYPRPEVDGVVLVLRRRRPWAGEDCFERLTACLFSSRNKKAYKIASRCTGVSAGEARALLGDKRVRELTLWEVERLLELGGCTTGPA